MATDLHKGVFRQILLNNLPFHVLFEKVVYIWVGMPDFREENLG